MEKKPLISVIMGTYNRAPFLARSINSVLNQTIKNLEFIIIDNGSTDNTSEIIKEFQSKDDRIKYFYTKNFGNVATPLNIGIQKSIGEYVTFHASDDESVPTWLEKQLGLFQTSKNQPLDVSSCNIMVVDSKSKKRTEVSKPKFLENDLIIKKSLTHNYIFGNLVARQGFFQNVGLYDENLKIGEDFDMWVRLLDAGYKFDFVYEPLYITYLHDQQSSNVNFKIHSKVAEYLLEKHRKIFKRYTKEYSKRFRSCGVLFLLSDDRKKARKYIINAILKYPLNFRAYLNLIFTFFSEDILYFLQKIKNTYLT